MDASTPKRVVIEISAKTIFLVLVVAFGVWFTFQIKDILFTLFIAFILTSALAPLVDFFERLKLPTILGILLTYFSVLIILSLAVVTVIPTIISQTEALLVRLPFFVGKLLQFLGFARDDDYLLSAYTDHVVRFMTSKVDELGKGAIQVTLGFFSGIVALVTILVVSFYLLLDRRRLHQNFVSLFPIPYQEGVRQLTLKVEHQLGYWMRGQLTLMTVVGVMTFVGLTILRIPFALPLAVIAGALEIVPMIGPTLSAIPAVIIAVATNPAQGILVLALYTAVQQLENNLLVPQVMKRAVGLNPLLVIVALAIGARLMGVIGALLAVPAATVIFILANELLNLSLEENSSFWTEASK